MTLSAVVKASSTVTVEYASSDDFRWRWYCLCHLIDSLRCPLLNDGSGGGVGDDVIIMSSSTLCLQILLTLLAARLRRMVEEVHEEGREVVTMSCGVIRP